MSDPILVMLVLRLVLVDGYACDVKHVPTIIARIHAIERSEGARRPFAGLRQAVIEAAECKVVVNRRL